MTDARAHPLVSEELAEELDKSRNLLHAYADCKQILKSVGDMPSVVAIENSMRKEHRRMRAVGKESPDVLAAMARTRALEQDAERKRRRLLDEDN